MTSYIATADFATIGDTNRITVDTIVPATSDETGIGDTVFASGLSENGQGVWDAQLAAAGFTRASEWKDASGYWTADVTFTNQKPSDYSALVSAMITLQLLDPVHRARRCPALQSAMRSVLGEYRDAAVYEVSRGGWGDAAKAIGVSTANVNGAVTRHRSRVAAEASR